MTNYSDHLLNTIDRATVNVGSINEINKEMLDEILEINNFCIIKGLISSETIKSAKEKIKLFHDPQNEKPATGEHPDELMTNFQKLSIGEVLPSGIKRPRCMRTFYNPLFAEDIFGLRESFITAAMVRNILYGFELGYTIYDEDENFWTASRVHNYPCGGGFLSPHKHTVVSSVQKKSNLSNLYFQPVILMSKKGEDKDCDFSSGGGFFEVNGESFFYEENCELGDLIIYSGETTHGVADIDHQKIFDSHKVNGRFAGFVTLYKKFNERNELNEFVKS